MDLTWKILFLYFLVCLFLPSYGDGEEELENRPNPGSYFHDPQNIHNREHIKEHMNEMYQEKDMEEQVKLDTNEAMEFHYFKVHDYDKNNKLDGLELRVALSHFHDEDGGNKGQNLEMDEKDLAALISQILLEDDLNNDGFIDYYEFINAQRGKDSQ